MNQYIALLTLRIKQGYRYLEEIGFALIAVMLFVLTGSFFSALETILSTQAIGSIPLTIIALVLIEVKRKDNIFLKSIFETKKKFFQFKFIENLMITLPISIFQIAFLRMDLLALIMLCCGLISIASYYFVKSSDIERKRSIKFIPLSLFEIRFYFEKKIWSFGILWIILMLGGFHFSLWILGILFLCMVPVEIYAPMESKEMLNFEAFFVRKKILTAIGFFLVYIAIPSLITIIFSQVNLIIILYGVLALIIAIILAISKKYISYHGVVAFQASSTSTIILILLMLAPGGILITFIACIYYYLQAEKHMKQLYAII